MDWTIAELVEEAALAVAALPPPTNGQVRPVPDERTVRYYGTRRLLDAPKAMRGRTALYGRKHLAQIVAIKRLQGAGRSLDEIADLWRTLNDQTLQRMSGVDLRGGSRKRDFWKADAAKPASPAPPVPQSAPELVEMRFALAPHCYVGVAVSGAVALSPADVSALRAAAAPLVEELARRGLATNN